MTERKAHGDRPATENAELRLSWHERDLEQAASVLEDAQQKLYRRDGTCFYSDEEHAERLGKLREEFAQKIEKIVSGLEEDATEYEREARSYSYTDPTKGLTDSERARLESSRPFVVEDCEQLSLEELVNRLGALSAGTDKVAKILHARYAGARVRQIDERLDQEAKTGRRTPGPSPDIAQLSGLRAALGELEEQLKDQKMEERRKVAEKAAKQSRQLVRKVRRRQGEVDGTEERVLQQHAERVRSFF